MRDFQYYNPTRIIFGEGQIDSLGAQIDANARVLLVAGGGSIKQNGVYEQVVRAMGQRYVVEHWGIESNPDLASVLVAKELALKEGCDFLLAVGGGSVIDATKFLAGLCKTTDDAAILLTRGGRFTNALPVGVVLTAPGTGSESNPHGAISNRAKGQKQLFSSPACLPKFAILDPEVTFSLPQRQVANGVADAFVHVLEQYLTYPDGGLLSDRLAESVLLTLLDVGPKTVADAGNYDLRANFMWCANLALNGLLGLGVPQDWTTHHIGHELTALFEIEHARTLAVVLPAVLHLRREHKRAKLLQYAERVFGIITGSEDERCVAAIERTREFFELLGLPTRLSAYGLSEDCVPRIVANLKAVRRVRLGERLDITLDNVATILKSAL